MDAIDVERALEAAWNGLESCYNPCRGWVFERRAKDLVQRAEITEGSQVLDLGTGTGIAAFCAREKAGRDGRVVGIDASAGLLQVARREARRRATTNVDFLRTSMLALALPGDAFDRVIGNYSVCCSPSYETTLREAHRVLRSGGTLIYNHEGPHPHPAATTLKELLESHRVEDPPPELRSVREANSFVEAQMLPYKDPSEALEAVKAAGFRDAIAAVSSECLVFASPEAYLDYKLTGSLELAALTPDARRAFRDAARTSLCPHVADGGIVLEQEVLTLHGVK